MNLHAPKPMLRGTNSYCNTCAVTDTSGHSPSRNRAIDRIILKLATFAGPPESTKPICFDAEADASAAPQQMPFLHEVFLTSASYLDRTWPSPALMELKPSGCCSGRHDRRLADTLKN